MIFLTKERGVRNGYLETKIEETGKKKGLEEYEGRESKETLNVILCAREKESVQIT